MGANGAGKSTLIKILLGLLDATRGSARVFDLDVATQGLAIRQLVGYMPEHDCLPPDISATEFVNHMARMSGLPRASARERTADVLRHVGLFEERYRPMGGYSTGMKQRVKLAQALVHDPRLLLLDEPTNGLDPAGRDEMLDLIHRTGTEFGIAIIMASHLLGEIERVCDFLVAIDAGRLLRAAALGTFTQHTGTLIVEVDERPGGAGTTAGRAAARACASTDTTSSSRCAAMPPTTSCATRSSTSAWRSSASSHGAAAWRTSSGTSDVPREARSLKVTGDRRHAGCSDRPAAGRGPGRIDLRPRLPRLRGSATGAPRSRQRPARRTPCAPPTAWVAAPAPRSCRSGSSLAAILPSLLALGIIALVAQLGRAGEAIEAISPIRYSTLFPFIAVLVFLFCASQAPELFGRDQRAGVLPLYFSRATSRLDYAAARALGLLVSLLVLVLAPQLLLLVGRVLVAPDPVAGLADGAARAAGRAPRGAPRGDRRGHASRRPRRP